MTWEIVIVVIERKWEVCFRVLCQIRGRTNIYKLYNQIFDLLRSVLQSYWPEFKFLLLLHVYVFAGRMYVLLMAVGCCCT